MRGVRPLRYFYAPTDGRLMLDTVLRKRAVER